jgi:hypothetical protein
MYFNFDHNFMIQQINDNFQFTKHNSSLLKKKKNNNYGNNFKKNYFILYLVLIRLITLDMIYANNSDREINVFWYTTNFSAVDIGVGSKGDLFTIGIDKNLYLYEFNTNEFIKIERDTLTLDKEFNRVDVDDNGNPYVITSDFQIYTYDHFGNWIHLPGCGKDIGIGKNNNFWKIGCNEEIDGNGAWSLFCFNNINIEDKNINLYDNKEIPFNNQNKNNYQKKIIIFDNKYYGYSNRKYIQRGKENKLSFNLHSLGGYRDGNSDCFWIKSDTSGVRIDVGQNGHPVLADREGNLKIYSEVSKKTLVFQGIKVRDVTVSNDDIIFVTDFNDFSIYKLGFKKKDDEIENYFNKFLDNKTHYVEEHNYEWIKLSGKGTNISAGPYSQPFVIDREGILLSSSKFGFN